MTTKQPQPHSTIHDLPKRRKTLMVLVTSPQYKIATHLAWILQTNTGVAPHHFIAAYEINPVQVSHDNNSIVSFKPHAL